MFFTDFGNTTCANDSISTVTINTSTGKRTIGVGTIRINVTNIQFLDYAFINICYVNIRHYGVETILTFISHNVKSNDLLELRYSSENKNTGPSFSQSTCSKVAGFLLAFFLSHKKHGAEQETLGFFSAQLNSNMRTWSLSKCVVFLSYTISGPSFSIFQSNNIIDITRLEFCNYV